IHSSIKLKQRLGGIIRDIGNSLSRQVLAIIARDLRPMDEVAEITTTILYLQHQEVADALSELGNIDIRTRRHGLTRSFARSQPNAVEIPLALISQQSIGNFSGK
ncbi:MAG: hypothetical protein HOK54_13780, partial [Alphaproteobacteria bacterium]|nr:hypothetical protein [Alphaproteobacteria bacterium]